MVSHVKTVLLCLWCVAVAAMLVCPAPTAAASPADPMPAGTLQLAAGKSIVIRSDAPIKRVSVANPEVADILLLSPKEIYVTGKHTGTTNLTLWQDGRVVAVYDLQVGYDISRLKQQLNDVLPNERDLQILDANDSITLAGKVSNAAALGQALALVRGHAPEGKVQNLVQVGGVHQVMLEVRVAEMSRTLTRRLGINILGFKGDQSFFATTLGNLTQVRELQNSILQAAPGAAFGSTWGSSAINALFRFNTNNTTWTGFVDALKEDGLIKVLAEPTLITLSGQEANFLAGGEFPVPVPQGLGTTAIEWKPFGVALSFTPVVLSENKISIKVAPEVSDLDYTTAVVIQGTVIPGLRTRRTSTLIELGDGQSFAVAGLLRDNMRSVSSKYPLLGEIPILGALFQSKQFQKEETELIIIVTPHLVKPLDMAKQPLPTDFYSEPNDLEFYMLGKLEGGRAPQPKRAAGKFDGDFGHSMPKN